jgi:hypothetical protein
MATTLKGQWLPFCKLSAPPLLHLMGLMGAKLFSFDLMCSKTPGLGTKSPVKTDSHTTIG